MTGLSILIESYLKYLNALKKSKYISDNANIVSVVLDVFDEYEKEIMLCKTLHVILYCNYNKQLDKDLIPSHTTHLTFENYYQHKFEQGLLPSNCHI